MNYSDGETKKLVYPWGKKDEEGNSHRLEYHCADVAACFEALITQPIFRQRMEAAAGSELKEEQISRLCALAFLHDFGKLNTAFQFQLQDRPHGHIFEAYCLPQINQGIADKIFSDIEKWESIEDYCICALSHHGSPVLMPKDPGKYSRCWSADEDEKYDPSQHVKPFMECLHEWFPQAFSEKPSSHLPSSYAFQHGFAGLLMLADWLGSDSGFFPFKPDKEVDRSYFETARKKAETAIEKTGLAKHAGVNGELKPEDFDVSRFTRFNSVQEAVRGASVDARLIILESETGSGKTEAAFIRFAQLFAAGKVDGMYFAVPTRSAAKQLHSRIHRAFEKYVGGEAVLAVPGYIVAGEAKGHPLPDWKGVLWNGGTGAQRKNERWAAERPKRFLAARCAVGTIDQVLLSGLRVRHSHLRASSLMRSLLVVDEVHASDVYMNKVLNNILKRHCDTFGGHAMLMSATLGSSARCQYLGKELPELEEAKETQYPILHTKETSQKIMAHGYSRKVAMEVQHCMTNSKEVAQIAIQEAQQGAKVLLIRNTVNQAIDTASQIEKLGEGECLMCCRGVTAIHHGRFASADRRLLDEEVEKTLCPGDRKLQGVIVIGTQTLEQSLDIDADVLITDLCPIDVLLQRIGRLHRHRNTSRPQNHKQPICHVLVPNDELTPENVNMKKYGLGIDSVYEDMRILAATQREIEEHGIWEIPNMNRQLVESATHPSLLAEWENHGEAWRDHTIRLEGGGMAVKMQAESCSVDWGCSFYDNSNCSLHDEEKVRTRLGSDSCDVEFDEQTSCFEEKVSELSIPHYWLKNLDPQSVDAENDGKGGFYLNIDKRRFKYDKFGLAKDSG